MRSFAVLILMSAVLTCLGTDIRFAGFADTYMAARLDHGNWNSMRSRLRVNLSSGSGSSWLFASVNAEKNHIIEEKTEVELRELWFEYAASEWDVRVGRQIFKWGNTDGIPITDVICPGDYSEYITRDFDDTRMPVDAFQFRLLPAWGSFEVIWLPIFEPGVYPSEDNPWTSGDGIPEGDILDDPVNPERSLENSETAGRISLYASGMDLALSVFHTWDDSPAMHRHLEGETVHWEPRYHRMGYFGAEISVPVRETVIRGEAAFITGKRFYDSETEDRTVERDAVKALAGLDWYPSGDWTVSVQLAERWIPDHLETMSADEHEVQGTLLVSRKFMRQTLELKNMVYIGISGEDLFDQVTICYHLTDALEITAGTDFLAGPEDSGFGRYEDNTQAWFKVKYSF